MGAIDHVSRMRGQHGNRRSGTFFARRRRIAAKDVGRGFDDPAGLQPDARHEEQDRLAYSGGCGKRRARSGAASNFRASGAGRRVSLLARQKSASRDKPSGAVLNRLQHRIVVEGNVGHRSGLQDLGELHRANAVSTEALGDLEEGRGLGFGGLKLTRERLISCDKGQILGPGC